jgi:hypothetical protein
VVEVNGVELDPADPNRVLKWKRGESNRFANFGPVAATVHPDLGTTQDWDWDQWTRFADEVRKPVGEVKFKDGPAGLKDLGAVDPDDVTVTGVTFPDLTDPKPGDAGADPDKVARPAETEP